MDKAEAVAPLTGRNSPTLHKADKFRHEPRKFADAGLTPTPTQMVRSPYIRECPMQQEIRATGLYRPQSEQGELYRTVEAQVEHVHAILEIIQPATQRIDTEHWSLPVYVFRQYFGTSDELGRTFRPEGEWCL